MAVSSPAPKIPTPGFFHLDLFAKDTKDISPWYDELKARMAQETGPIESAMTNLLGVFAFYKLRGQGEARKLLEDLTRRDENNLNGIANKQFIYGQLMRAKDEIACRDRLQELLADKSDTAMARNARCFVEQGYALINDVRDDSKDMVSKIRHAISLFETALSLVGNIDTVAVEEILVWKFYLSKCYWRLDQVVTKHMQDKVQLAHDDRLIKLIRAQSLLIEVTKLDPDWKSSRFYRARAWAMLGSLEGKCKKNESYETPDYIKKMPQIGRTLGSQLSCLQKAADINPNDSEVYRRFGEIYRREHMYEDAHQMLEKSIAITPGVTSNWVAYGTRSLVNVTQYGRLAQQSRDTPQKSLPSKELLERAKEDAIASCDGAATPLNIFRLGKVCHLLAIHPLTDAVEDRAELDDAIDYFAQALQLEDGYTNPAIHAARGRSLEALGEYEKAAESYKRAVENHIATNGYLWNLTGVLRNLLLLHADCHKEHYIAELAFWINEGYKKYTDITPAIRGCVFKFRNQMIQVCQYLIGRDNFQLARICLNICVGGRDRTCRSLAKSMLSKLPNENGASRVVDNSKHSEQDETRVSVPVAVDTPRHGQEFRYDFFVSHSSKDVDWVNYALLPALEGDMQFKGCIADRDFVPGKSVFDNIIYSIENSFKTLLILTPNFVTSEWCKYETEQALMESLKGKTRRIIPIMLHKCDVPDSIRTITYFDVSCDTIGSYDWLRLKKALEMAPT